MMGAWPLFPLLSPDKRHSKEVMIVSCDQYTGGHRLVLWVTQYWRTQLISLNSNTIKPLGVSASLGAGGTILKNWFVNSLRLITAPLHTEQDG